MGNPGPQKSRIGRAVRMIVESIDLRCYGKLFYSRQGGRGCFVGVLDPRIRGIGRAVRMIVNPLSLAPLAFFPFSLLIVTCLGPIAHPSIHKLLCNQIPHYQCPFEFVPLFVGCHRLPQPTSHGPRLVSKSLPKWSTKGVKRKCIQKLKVLR